MKTADLLLEFSQQAGVPGVNQAIKYATKKLEPFGKVEVDPLGSVVCTVKEPTEGQPHILLDAHIDEIGLIVTYIEDDGFIRVGQIGGTDPRLLAASRVTVHTSKGGFNGVIASIPPHLSGGQPTDTKPADEIYIDVGMTKEQTEDSIPLGSRITFHSRGAEMLNDNVTVKALDDRSGCVCLLKALEYLDGDIPCGLTVMFSTMEEIGGMGAKTSAYKVNPTHALAVDVSFASTPDSPTEKTAKLGAGPMIGYAPVLDHEISLKLESLAKDNEIPYQHEVVGGRTGTNVDSIVTSRSGVRCALLSVPQRYMHTPVEMVNVNDVENIGKLISLWVKSFKA